MLNPHSEFIDTRISVIHTQHTRNSTIIDTTHEDCIREFGSNVFTNLIRTTFPAAYLNKHACSDCKGASNERCHGIGDERPLLIQKAREKVYPDISTPIARKTSIIQFLEEHTPTHFTFKCSECHRKERTLPFEMSVGLNTTIACYLEAYGFLYNVRNVTIGTTCL